MPNVRPPPALLVALCGGLSVCGCAHGQPALVASSSIQPVELRFIHSPYADYLFYLLYRDTSPAPALRAVPIRSIPILDQLVALPEITASARVRSYGEILPLV